MSSELQIIEYFNNVNRIALRNYFSFKQSDIGQELVSVIKAHFTIFDDISPPYLDDLGSNFITSGRFSDVEITSDVRIGKILKLNRRFKISLNDGIYYKDLNKFREVLSHELGHTYIYKLSENTLDRMIRYDIFDAILYSDQYKKIEDFSSRIGRELLVPCDDLPKYFNNISLRGFIELSKVFKVNIELISRRLLEDVYYFDEKQPFIRNSLMVIDDNNKRRIIGKIPIKMPFMTENDLIKRMSDDDSFYVDENKYLGLNLKIISWD